MKEIVAATRNKKKLLELKRLLRGIGIRVLCLSDFEGLPEVKEDGKTFKANAKKKALAISSRIKRIVMADDSGLEVPALGMRPGIHSARYAGPSQNDKKNIAKLLKKMKPLSGKDRRAHFRCVICLSKGRKVIRLIEGKVRGRIAEKPRGGFGFGYDPVFIPSGFERTFSQLSSRAKDRISHRAMALKEAKKVIHNLLYGNSEF